jgi:hypothetical protein
MKNKKNLGSLLIAIMFVTMIGIVVIPEVGAANHTTFEIGDVFVSVGNRQVYWYLPDGTFNQALTAGISNRYTTGMVFDADDNLYVTMFDSGTVCKFDNTGTYLGTFGSGYSGSPESIVIDANGDFYVGAVDGDNDIRKFDAAGTLLDQYDVLIEDRGSDWIDLDADQCTMFYTSEGKNIFRYDLCTHTQLSNFNVAPLPGSHAFALRLLPAGGLLVADTQMIVRLDATGNVIQTYDAAGENYWFALNLDPDGTSFWSADYSTNNVYKFDIATGAILLSFNTGTGPSTVYGLTVFGEITVGRAIPVHVDIKPGSCPNPINLKGKGVFPVAICGTEDFDVTTIDPGTILLTREGYEDVGVSPIRWSYEDVATPYTGEEECGCHDLNGDGYMDLTLKFDKGEVITTLELDTVAEGTIPLIITGNLVEEEGGTPITGQDCVWIVENREDPEYRSSINTNPIYQIIKQFLQRFPLLQQLLSFLIY